MLDNYPTGAMSDPDAPFAQPERYSRCRYDHPDDEPCGILAEDHCPICERPVCEEGLIERRLQLPGGGLKYKCCEECILRVAIPKNPDDAVTLLHHAMDHIFRRQQIDVSERLQNAEILRECAAWVMVSMARESHEATERRIAAVEAA